METILGCLFIILIFLVLVPAVSAISAWITMWAWNMFMVSVFHLPAITFWQAFALWLLLGMIKGIFSVTVNKKE